MDSAYEWRKYGDDWLLDTDYVHDQFTGVTVQEDGVTVPLEARELNFIGAEVETQTGDSDGKDITIYGAESLTVTCVNDVLTITLSRTTGGRLSCNL